MAHNGRTTSALERESLEMEYRLHQPEQREMDGYNRVVFYIGLLAFALVGASILF